jgi:hypothetical protein
MFVGSNFGFVQAILVSLNIGYFPVNLERLIDNLEKDIQKSIHNR